MANKTPRELYKAYAAATAYVAVTDSAGIQHIGSAFHVGGGIFLTARHVVESNNINEIATTMGRYVLDPNGAVTFHDDPEKYRYIPPAKGKLIRGPLVHPDPKIDVAALVVEGIDAAVIPLGSHLDDWMGGDEFVLNDVLVLGYPPVPTSTTPTLVATRAEVNAMIDKYTSKHPHFIVSAPARGGFSGGPCLVEFDFALGLVTESLVHNAQPSELGFMSVITVEPLLVCLQHHGIVPEEQYVGLESFLGVAGTEEFNPNL
ncbi:MAG TPA: serine protease [Gammaproteobacteria bacterium]|nr:serine protease [Gammaproteobacteria bacterium]